MAFLAITALAFSIYVSVRFLDSNAIRRIRLLEAVLWVYSLSPLLILAIGYVLHLFLDVWNPLWVIAIWLGASDTWSQTRDYEDSKGPGEQQQIIDAIPRSRALEPGSRLRLFLILVLTMIWLILVVVEPRLYPFYLFVLVFLSPYYALWRLRSSIAKEAGLSPLLHL
jgi:hypothetical protein